MFLELHLSEDNNEKIMLNIDRIQSIYQIKSVTNIYTGDVVYKVKENYDQIKELINDYISEKRQKEDENKNE